MEKEEQNIKIHNLGKSKRVPLASAKVNIVQPIYSYVGKHQENTIIKSVTTYPAISLYKPLRIIKQQIGIPFEIRVPVSQVRYL